MTSSERRALLFLSAVALLGTGVRAARGRGEGEPPTAESRQALARHIQRVDSAERAKERKGRGGAASRAGARRRRATAGAGESSDPSDRGRPPGRRRRSADAEPRPLVVDLDVAGVEEIERLPRIGPALARRIVASRDSLGPFGELGAVERVRGVGPKVAAAIAPHVTFSGRQRP